MIEPHELTETGAQPVHEKRRLPSTPQVRFLSRLIEVAPDAPVNYLLRAEEWLLCGERAQARADFEAARDRSQRLLGQSAWGYIYQAYIDRAEAGLRQCLAGADVELSEGY
jgi:hypothetical protein